MAGRGIPDVRRHLALALVLAAVLVAHYAYYLWPDLTRDRQSAKYVGDGLGFALLCAVAAWQSRGTSVGALVTAAATWGALEGLQQFGCGLATWAQPARAGDLCIQLVGPWPYIATASALLAWLITRKK